MKFNGRYQLNPSSPPPPPPLHHVAIFEMKNIHAILNFGNKLNPLLKKKSSFNPSTNHTYGNKIKKENEEKQDCNRIIKVRIIHFSDNLTSTW